MLERKCWERKTRKESCSCQSLHSFVKLGFLLPSRARHKMVWIRKKTGNWGLWGWRRRTGNCSVKLSDSESLNLKLSDSENLTNTTLERNRTLKYSRTLVCPQHEISMRLMHLGILCWNTTLNTESLLGFDIVSSVTGYALHLRLPYAMHCIIYLYFCLEMICMFTAPIKKTSPVPH